MNKFTAEIIGWYGVVAILSAYALVSFGILEGDGLIFQLLNLTGAFGVIVASVKKKAFQPAVLNIAWAVIAFVVIIKMFV